jgi:hypothetical protein
VDVALQKGPRKHQEKSAQPTDFKAVASVLAAHAVNHNPAHHSTSKQLQATMGLLISKIMGKFKKDARIVVSDGSGLSGLGLGVRRQRLSRLPASSRQQTSVMQEYGKEVQ